MTLAERKSALRLLKPFWKVLNERAVSMGLEPCAPLAYHTEFGTYIGANSCPDKKEPRAMCWEVRLDTEMLIWRLWGTGSLVPWLPFFGEHTPSVSPKSYKSKDWMAFITLPTDNRRAARWMETEITWAKIEAGRAEPPKPIKLEVIPPDKF